MAQKMVQDKVVVVTGAGGGIGRDMALALAAAGAKVVVNDIGTSTSGEGQDAGPAQKVVEEIKAAGGQAVANTDSVAEAVAAGRIVQCALDTFGRIDAVVNNASAIDLSRTLDLAPKRYDLMADVNARGTFMLTRAALPHLLRSANPHVLTLSPPLNLEPRWLGTHVGYMLAKYAMTLATLGFAEEFRADGVAANTLWPRTTIATAAVQNLLGGDRLMAASRTPEIYADAAHLVLTTPSRERTGQSLLVEDVLAEVGITDLSRYAAVPGTPDEALFPDVFL